MTLNLKILGFWGGFPVSGGATSSYLITTDQGRILLDCGSGSMSQLSKFQPIYDLDAVIISHLHNDHLADILTLEHALIVAGRKGLKSNPLPIYSPNLPLAAYKRINSSYFDRQSIKSNCILSLKGINVSFLPVHHTVPCFAIKVSQNDKTIVYTGDTQYFSGLIDFVKEADLLLCEASIVKGSNHTSGKGHMSGFEAGKLARLANVNQLVLTHLPTDGNLKKIEADAKSEFNGRVFLASQKNEWEI
ncbi:MBL fold metallo-hydrolase [Facklamia miroungae]|uniref:Ribonuclease BN, tRNA processing enzyme n=1 Tax=Facklamia miroungae TaxID=120956 RepID=A0A1G7V5Y6_9LACT|nr:MBL fold metallo-hydrolase [Facklamia miroungae]NKZ30226.1 MBL fold metallo-hydrolase [Facklamia miroungae]SDG54370.1 Ribonuclease BN, tRNA processing enzyme [Facklamia miroungae]